MIGRARAGARAGRGPWAVSLLALALVAGAAPAQAGSEGGRQPRTPAAVVRDATGLVVGPVLQYTGFAVYTALEVGGRRVLLLLDRTRFLFGSDFVVYEGVACNTAPYLQGVGSGSGEALYAAAGIGPGRVVYGAAGAGVDRNLNSIWNSLTETCDAHVEAATVRPAVEIGDLDTLEPALTPPFSAGP